MNDPPTVGSDLLAYVYENPRIQMNELISKFSGIKHKDVILHIIEKVLFCKVNPQDPTLLVEFRNEVIEIMINVLIYAESTSSLKELSRRLNIPYRSIHDFADSFIDNNEFIDLVFANGYHPSKIELIKIAVYAPFIKNCLKLGLSNQAIIKELSGSITMGDLEKISEQVWGVGIAGARKLFNTRKI